MVSVSPDVDGEGVKQRRDKETWLWHWFAKADDFIAGLVLILLGAIALAAFLLVKHQDRDAVLKLAGGALILFTSYSAARTLALNRLDQRTGRIMEATKMLEEQSNAARAGGLETLVNIAVTSKSPHEIEQVEIIKKALAASTPDASGEEALERVADFLERRKRRRLFRSRNGEGSATGKAVTNQGPAADDMSPPTGPNA
jgi:gluconate kinase